MPPRPLPTNGLRLLAGRRAQAADRKRARRRADRGSRRSRRIVPRLGSSEQIANRCGKLFPDLTPLGERTIATPSQRVDPSSPTRFGGHPATGEQARLLETMQRWVDRPLGKVERAAAAAFNLLDDRVAMC